jgi:hypothetical protein
MSWLKWAAVAAGVYVAYKVGVKMGETNRLKLDAKKVLGAITGQPGPEEG